MLIWKAQFLASHKFIFFKRKMKNVKKGKLPKRKGKRSIKKENHISVLDPSHQLWSDVDLTTLTFFQSNLSPTLVKNKYYLFES